MRPLHHTRVYLHLDRLDHNLRLLKRAAANRPLWPAVKANAYGHGLEIIAHRLAESGITTLCVADIDEAMRLFKAVPDARVILLSAMLPEHAPAIVSLGCEACVCTREMAEALAREGDRRRKRVFVHLKVDTGMGRCGIRPHEIGPFLEWSRSFPALRINGVMSHFASADQAEKESAREQINRFNKVVETAGSFGITSVHMANSAAIFDLPESLFSAVRPGIAIYGLAPSAAIANPLVKELRPVLEWKTRVTFLKTVPPGTGLSYGHIYHTKRSSHIATIPVGYGDGLCRNLSGKLTVLVGGRRCPQVGRITMDQCLIDVTALQGRVGIGDEVVLIGRQAGEEISADELASRQGTINYEVVTAIAERVPRLVFPADDGGGR